MALLGQENQLANQHRDQESEDSPITECQSTVIFQQCLTYAIDQCFKEYEIPAESLKFEDNYLITTITGPRNQVKGTIEIADNCDKNACL
ncbi:unnamed protein product [Clavelina lepadiformis]|uniref:Uncharacterized protein n=1 Tax=Clavelina lepadiformis TaxID=159417 RepID=A0ABP0G9F3_CLALP